MMEIEWKIMVIQTVKGGKNGAKNARFPDRKYHVKNWKGRIEHNRGE
jgi:hypothetical protein